MRCATQTKSKSIRTPLEVDIEFYRGSLILLWSAERIRSGSSGPKIAHIELIYESTDGIPWAPLHRVIH